MYCLNNAKAHSSATWRNLELVSSVRATLPDLMPSASELNSEKFCMKIGVKSISSQSFSIGSSVSLFYNGVKVSLGQISLHYSSRKFNIGLYTSLATTDGLSNPTLMLNPFSLFKNNLPISTHLSLLCFLNQLDFVHHLDFACAINPRREIVKSLLHIMVSTY